jgi:thioredoxin-related protein
MRILRLLMFVFFLGAASFTLASSSNGIAWQPYSNASFTKAKDQHVLVLVFVEAEWCHWCQEMKKTYADPNVASFINKNFIPIQLDIDKNPDIAKQLNIIKFPATIIMDENRHIINKIDGYSSPSQFIDSLNQNMHVQQSSQNSSAMDITIVGKKKIL